MPDKAIIFFVGIGLLFCVFGVVMVFVTYGDFKDKCEAVNGIIYDTGKHGAVCTTQDGRILFSY